jgi:hypothetical protein
MFIVFAIITFAVLRYPHPAWMAVARRDVAPGQESRDGEAEPADAS